MTASTTLKARVHAMQYEADGIVSVELRPIEPEVFPTYEPGAHIDLHLGNGLVRSYSLCQLASAANATQSCYRVGVLADKKSRGGSRYIHEQLRVGAPITISAPRNNFELDLGAAHSVLVAGGIGVTPVLCMLRKLVALGKSTEFIYCARNRKEAAFIETLTELQNAHDLRIQWHFDEEAGGPPALEELLGNNRADAHYYCCGPTPMLSAFENACAQLGYDNVHIERFAPVELPPSSHDDGFEVYLERSAKTLEVPAGKSILDAMLDAGLPCDYSCKEGVCGACEVTVLDGEVEHFDGILTKKEKESNQVMMVCVSRCKGNRLVLDL